MALRIYDRYGNPRVGNPAPQAGNPAGGHTGGSGISRYYVAGQLGCTALTTGAPAVGTLRAYPLRCPPRKGTIDQLAFLVTTLLAGNGRIGAFRNADKAGQNLYPGALIADSGSISTATATLKTFATTITYDPGELLWLAYESDSAATLRCIALAGLDCTVLGLDSALATTPGFGITAVRAYAALPATFPGGGAVQVAVPAPALAARFAA